MGDIAAIVTRRARPAHAAAKDRGLRLGMLALMLGCHCLSAATPVAPPLPALTNIAQVRRLTPEEANRNPWVSLHGVVTLCVSSNQAFVQDATGGILVYVSRTQSPLQPGQTVTISGQARSGQYAPVVFHALLSNSPVAMPMPAPWPVVCDELLDNHNHAQWIETVAVVRCVPPSETPGTYLEAVAGDHRMLIIITDVGHEPIPAEFFGATVKFRGVCASLFNRTRQIRGAKIYVQGYTNITVLEPATATPDAVPLRTIGSLATFTPESIYVHSVRLRGTVTHAVKGPQPMLYLDDNTGAIVVQLQENQPVLSPGSRVELVGFPEAGESSTLLNDAAILVQSKGPAPQPRDVGGADLFSARSHAKLVRLQGRVLKQVRNLDQWMVFVRAGEVVVSGQLDAAQLPPQMPALVEGSLVELTGICRSTTDNPLNAPNPSLLLRSMDDLRIVGPPEWWTPRRTLYLVGALCLAVLASLAWLAALRRQVQRQTATLRAQLQREAVLELQCRDLYENSSDIIFDQDLNGELLSVNPALARLTGHTADEARLLLVAALAQARAGNPAATTESFADLTLALRTKDSRSLVLDAHAQRVRHGGTPERWLGIARDVTERKQAGEILRRAKQQLESANQHLAAGNHELQEANLALEDQITERRRAVAQVELVRRELRESSRLAGKAEMATDVLHNVGNILNSVSVSTSFLQGQIRKSRSTNLARVAALLREHRADLGTFLTHDEKGRQLPPYLAQLAGHLEAERATLQAEAEELMANLAHIRDIISLQQSYAHMSGTTDSVPVKDLIEDALRLHAGASAQRPVSIVRDYRLAPMVTANRHQLFQILVSLLQNAGLADSAGQSAAHVAIRIDRGGPGRICVEVTDDRPGLAPEEIARLFTLGAPTRPDGYGAGLATAARLAAEMGGALSARSSGPGLGTTFTLELPAQPEPN